jgi:hypothetical protein
MPLIPFAEYRPDLPALGPFAREARNVVPAAQSYRPLNALSSASSALTARAQGAAWFRGTDGTTKMFAGDATKLYLLDDATWDDVSQAATTYAPGADGTWRFTQFGVLAIAVDGVSDPQKFDLGAGTAWADLGGTPPAAKFIGTARDFVVLANIGSTRQRVKWSGFNNAEQWTPSASTQSDEQDMPDGGEITGFVGGEYGVVFQEASIRRMSYEGPPTVFRFDKIANDLGCTVPNSVAGFIDRAFFLHKSGFYMVVGGQQVVPIGRDKIDRTFWAEFDEGNMFRCSAAIDPVRSLYIFAYPAAGSSGTPNRLLIYNWVDERWARAILECEIVFGGVSQQSYTLEDLDSFGTLETLPYSLDSSFWTGSLSPLLFAFDTTHKSGSFSGATLEAVCETGEFNPGNGKRSIIRGCRPLIDGGSPLISIGSREVQQAAVAYGDGVGLTPAGLAPVYTSGRYFRARATMPAGEVWNNMQGIDDLDVRPAGGQ